MSATASVERNKDTLIASTVVEWKGEKFLDIRQYYKGAPTKNGVRVPLALAKDFLEGTQKLIKE